MQVFVRVKICPDPCKRGVTVHVSVGAKQFLSKLLLQIVTIAGCVQSRGKQL